MHIFNNLLTIYDILNKEHIININNVNSSNTPFVEFLTFPEMLFYNF